jgi:4-hydroxyphenylpyruvate dioxygenase-like putative hemolysin
VFLFTASLPSFSAPAARRFAADHGLKVRAIGLQVADAEEAFSASVAIGAGPAFEPIELGLGCENGISVVALVWGRAYMLYRLETTPSVVYMAW